MLFNSYGFLFAFLPATLVIVHTLRRWRLLATTSWALILLSLVFYAWWDVRLTFLLLGSIGFNWFMARQACVADRRRARLALIVAVAVDLGVLGFFKYSLFFSDLASFNFDGRASAYIWLLPLGISFWTFEQIIYLVDCYKGRQNPLGVRDYLFFVTFFPRLIAGPIVRPKDFFADLADWMRPVSGRMIAGGLTLAAIGLAKKVLVADELGSLADPVFAFADGGHLVGILDAWIGALAFTFQIYFDFSGYSDMAIGIALLMGVRLPPNFDAPYRSVSVTEFWRRWHMSLSSFLRDYLYKPLGGNRVGFFRHKANLMATMVLGGIWHGAGINFVIWGALHGCYLIAAHAARPLLAGRPTHPLAAAAGWAATFAAVTAAWVFFRADSPGGALGMLAGMTNNPGAGAVAPDPVTVDMGWRFPLIAYAALHCFALPSTTVLFGGLMGSRTAAEGGEDGERAASGRFGWAARLRSAWRPTPAWSALAAVLFGVSSWRLLSHEQQFIYFQF